MSNNNNTNNNIYTNIDNNNQYMVCKNDGNFSKVPLADLPCCHIYQSRTKWVSSILPPRVEDPQKVANQFPFWGLWRNQYSPPLPHVFYPMDIQPQGICNKNFYGGKDYEPNEFQINGLLSPNWALMRK